VASAERCAAELHGPQDAGGIAIAAGRSPRRARRPPPAHILGSV